MQFNSIAFVLAFAAFYPLYCSLGRHLRAQNALLLVASYAFYAWWDWRFLSLLLVSTLVDFVVAHALPAAPRAERKVLLGVSIATNLGILGTFKYFDFFVTSAKSALAAVGLHVSPPLLDVVLPLGISFYTFQTLGYTIDVYRGTQRPTASLVSFGVYVAFFPQLVAGPIERARRLLPQIERARQPDASQISAGMWLLTWGYLKKLVIADNAGAVTNYVFYYSDSVRGLDVVAGVFAFAVQIYADFSGYTDIARGLAKLMGFELSANFHLPYLAASPREFWQRWHVSLSTWLRDYVYVPLGGNRGGTWATLRNLAVTMLLGGLWHGARWNFVLWGAFHGGLLVAQRVLRDVVGPRSLPRAVSVPVTFLLVCFGWLLFRCESWEQITTMVGNLGLDSSSTTSLLWSRLAMVAAPLVVVHAVQQASGEYLLGERLHPTARAPVYALMITAILLLAERAPTEFLYFQF